MANLNLTKAFARLWIDIACPDCGLSSRIRLKEVIIESSIICRGCHMDFHLVQSDATGTRTMRRIQELGKQVSEVTRTINVNLKF